jgi:hypothetical protein
VKFDEINAKIIIHDWLAIIYEFEFVFWDDRLSIEEIRTADVIFLTIPSTETNERLLLSIYEIDSGRLVIIIKSI